MQVLTCKSLRRQNPPMMLTTCGTATRGAHMEVLFRIAVRPCLPNSRACVTGTPSGSADPSFDYATSSFDVAHVVISPIQSPTVACNGFFKNPLVVVRLNRDASTSTTPLERTKLVSSVTDTPDWRSMAPETRSFLRRSVSSQVDLKKTIILRLVQPIVHNLQCYLGLRSPGRSSIRVQSFRSRTERPNHC